MEKGQINFIDVTNIISNNHRYYDKAMEWTEKYIADNNLPRF